MACYIRRFSGKQVTDEIVLPAAFERTGEDRRVSVTLLPPEWAQPELREYQYAFRRDSGDLFGLLRVCDEDFELVGLPLPDLDPMEGPYGETHYSFLLPGADALVLLAGRLTLRLPEAKLLDYVSARSRQV